ncbi:hypothetical protein RRG08_035827 [Elysia crispata]|uniref:Uncharacterized protein n=1 Tax=Elysia crispata TaxID=231223 RepID=A0AAE1CLT2_9GAST|nr:hypothetical protein RRG08_035827 [Elysia crispata]
MLICRWLTKYSSAYLKLGFPPLPLRCDVISNLSLFHGQGEPRGKKVLGGTAFGEWSRVWPALSVGTDALCPRLLFVWCLERFHCQGGLSIAGYNEIATRFSVHKITRPES